MEPTEIMTEQAGQQGDGVFLVSTLNFKGQERTIYAFYENGHAAELSCLPAGGASILGNIAGGLFASVCT